MLINLKIKNILVFSICCLFIKVHLANYLTFELFNVDDCIRLINISNQTVFNFTPIKQMKICGDYSADNLGDCDAGKYDMYPGKKYSEVTEKRYTNILIKDFEYEYGTDVIMVFEDYDHTSGYMGINAYFNEFIIEPADEAIWKCLDCGFDELEPLFYDNYNYHFYKDSHKNNCSERFFTFVFRIDNKNQLYEGGKNGQPFKITENFYSFIDNGNIIKHIPYSEGKIELELINFIEPEILHLSSNATLPINYEEYYFQVEYNPSSVEGNLTGLTPQGEKKKLNNYDLFQVNDNSGLNYVISDNEKNNNIVQMPVTINVFNKCPEQYKETSPCKNKIIQKDFHFTIIIDPPDTSEATQQQNPPDTSQTTQQQNPPDTSQTTQQQNTPDISQTTQHQNPPDTSQTTQHQNPPDTSQTTQQQNPPDTSQSTQHQNPPDTSQTTQKQTQTSETTQKPSSSLDNSENISKEDSDNISTDKSSNIKVNISDCLSNYISYNEKKDLYDHLCPDFKKNEILSNLNDTITKIDKNTNYKIIGDDFIAIIIPIDYLDSNNTNNNKEIFSSSSYTNFTECEKKLRELYNIKSPRKITFVQIELNNTDEDILVRQIEYQAYDDNNNLLDLSPCESSNIQINYSFKDETKEGVDLINSFKKNGIDILDINDNFFNDVCFPYSDSEKDYTLNDRIQDIYKNYKFCEKNCELVEVNYEEYKATCNCSIKREMNMKDSNFDAQIVQSEKKSNNFQILKCHNAFSSLKNNWGNIGFWTFLGLMIINILLLILYVMGLKTIKNYIAREMANHGYIGKSDYTFCHNYIKKLDRLVEKLKNMKKNFIKKVGAKKAPPKKRKIKRNARALTSKNISGDSEQASLNATIKLKKNSKKNIRKNIELLKARMEKTKKLNANGKNVGSNILVLNKGNLSKSKGDSQNKYSGDNFKLNLININVEDAKKKVYIPNLSGHVLNIYTFQEAIKYDKRSFCTIYYIFLIAKQVIMHAIFYKSPMEPLPIRLSLLKFMLGCDLALNAIFYTDEKISEKYNSVESALTFAFTNNLIVILLSTLIGYILFIFLANMNNSTNAIRNLFREEEEKIKKNKNYEVSFQRKREITIEVNRIMKTYKIKIIIFYIVEFLCMIFFWYYVTIFCYMYKKTQLSWLTDCLLTIVIRIIIDFFLNIIFALLYKLAININSNCFFKTITFIYCFSS